MKYAADFFKGIIVGIGGVAPGLSGSVMMIILGLYEKAVNAISTLFKNFKENMMFLIPLVCGCGVGVLIFSKIVDFTLTNYEFQTRYLFLGLVLGTLPLFYKEVKKNGFAKKYYLLIAVAFFAGVLLFSVGDNSFQKMTEPSLVESVWLGVAVAGSSLVPGVDSAVILSALGLYELYVSSIAELNFAVLLPAGVGLVAGAFVISAIMNLLIKKLYTITFSIIFGLFLSIIPKVLTEACAIKSVGDAVLAAVLVIVGCAASVYFEDIKGNNKKIKKLLKG